MEVFFKGEEHSVKNCSATQHIVDEVAASNPSFFSKADGTQDDYKVLLYLGFDVRFNIPENNVQIDEEMLIRSSHDSTKAYKCRVYTGQIRKAANKENRQFWNKKKEQWEVPLLRPDKFHHMEKIYTKVGILQATDVTKFVKEDEFLNIQDITE